MPVPSLRMFGPIGGVAFRDRCDDTPFDQSLRELTRSAADDPPTLSPPIEDVLDAAAPTTHVRPGLPNGLAAAAAAPASGDWDAAPASYESPTYWGSKVKATRRLMISIAVVLGLFGMAVALEHLYARQGDGGRRHAFESSVSQAQAALARGDVDAAERALALFDAPQAGDPRVQALRRGVDGQRQAQAARRDALQDAARRASIALGFAEPALAHPEPARSPETVQLLAPVGPIAPVSPVGPPERVADESALASGQPGACNEALLALALCRTDPVIAQRGSR